MQVYNSEAYLEETMKTILNQSFEGFEFLIIDDCSTDGSKEIIKKFKDKRSRLIELEAGDEAHWARIETSLLKPEGLPIATAMTWKSSRSKGNLYV